jgi:hypothetical protein
MQDLKLDKIISPRPDKGPGFTNVKLKPSTKMDKRSSKRKNYT